LNYICSTISVAMYISLLMVLTLLHLSVQDSLAFYNLVSVLLTLYTLYRVQNVPLLNMIGCFCVLFPIYTLPFSLYGILISDYLAYQSDSLIFQFLLVHNMFIAGLFSVAAFFHGRIIRNNIHRLTDSIPQIKSDSISIFVSIAIIVGCLFFKGENIFASNNSYAAYVNNLTNENGLPEYLLIFVFLGLMIKTVRRHTWLLSRLSFVFYAYNLIVMGYRVQLLMLFLLFFSFSIESKINKRLILPLFVVGFCAFSLLGYLKDGGLDESFMIQRVFFDDSPGFVLSHHTGVIYSSLAILANVDSGWISGYDKFMNGMGLFLNSVIPSGVVNSIIPQANMAIFVKSHAQTAGGVYAPIVFYTLFGYLGVYVFGVLVAALFFFASLKSYSIPLSSIDVPPPFRRRKYFLSVAAVFVFVTFPRWVSYDVGNFLFRLPIYLLIIIAFIELIKGHPCRTKD
jgi:hypothetical protein